MARRYGGDLQRLWNGKHPEEFTGQDVRSFLTDMQSDLQKPEFAGQAQAVGVRQHVKALEAQITKERESLIKISHSYCDKLGEWDALSDEWQTLTEDIDHLSNNASYRYNSIERELANMASAALHARIQQCKLEYSPEQIYATLQTVLDSDGGKLSLTAMDITGVNYYREYTCEDSAGWLEEMNGFGSTKLIEAARFGQRHYSISGSYELLSEYRIDADTPKYREYREALYDSVLERLPHPLLSSPQKLLTALSRMDEVGRHELPCQIHNHDGQWVSFREHVSLYPYRESTISEHPAKAPVELPDFYHKPPPDYFRISIPQFDADTMSDKLQGILLPTLRAEVLQSHLEGLTRHKEELADMLQNITEMCDGYHADIYQMRDVYSKSLQSIQDHSAFDKHIAEQYKSEFDLLGLPPEQRSFHGLTGFLRQEAAVAQPTSAQATPVLEMEAGM